MAGRRQKKSGGRSYAWRYRGRIVACVFVEVIIICALVIMIGWNKGVKEWFEQFEQPVLKEVDISGINSPNAILMQARGGKILGEINGEAQIYPASMTKIMTVILGIENFDDLDEKITLTNEMFSGLYEQDATQAGFQPGEEVRVIDLLYGAMLPSGAECCIALADTISGSEADFAELMNKKARKLGMENTHFCDSTGLHNPDHYSTVKDIAVLMKYCIKNDQIGEDAGVLLKGKVVSKEPEWSLMTVDCGNIALHISDNGQPVGSAASLRILAREVVFAIDRPVDLYVQNAFEGTVEEISIHGDGADALVRTNCSGQIIIGKLTRKALSELGIKEGSRIWLLIKSVAVLSV